MKCAYKRLACATVFATLFGGAYGFSSMLEPPTQTPPTKPAATQPATPPAAETKPESKTESKTATKTPPMDCKVIPPGTEPTVDLTALDKVDEACWSELRTKRVYFAHQTVGTNILAGLCAVQCRKPEIKLDALGYCEPDKTDATPRSVFDSPGIFDAPSGKAGNPEQKIDDFAKFLRSPEGTKVDIALLKFCYSDIGRTTDTDALVDRYVKMVEQFKRDRPELRIITCTVPLKAEESGARARMKRLVGAGSDASNAARGRYNDAIRKRFPAAQIYDIAAAESRKPDGGENTVNVNGKRVQALAAEYTEDGAHLNQTGQMLLARDFLLTLTKQCRGSAETAPTVGTASGTDEPGGK